MLNYITSSDNELLAFKALHNLFESKGFSVDNFPKSLFYDYAVIFGTIKNRINLKQILKKIMLTLSRNFIVIETPVVGRQAQYLIHNENFFRVGVNGFFADKGFEYAVKKRNNDINKRNFLARSSISKKVEFKKNCHIGISLQLPGDASVRGIDQIGWILDLINGKYIPQRLINANNFIIRTPPLLKGNLISGLEILSKFDNISIDEGTNENKESFFDQINFLVTFSSTMGVDSLLRGVPAVGLDKRSFLRLVSNSTLTDCFNSRFHLADDYLNILCNTTWGINDLMSDHFYEMVIDA
jgi:hypothetical protein